MDTVEFEHFTKRLLENLTADPEVLGLIIVGSTADAAYRDAQSDHDFWLVVTPSASSRYRTQVAWLPNASEILLSVQHGATYRSVLYHNRHRLEYAVFTADDMPHGKLERYRILLDRGDVSEIASRIQASTLAPVPSRREPLQNLALLVWAGQQLLARGEWLSAHRYLAGFAVDNLLELLRRHRVLDDHPTADRLDPRRRLELLAPTLAAELHHFVALPLSEVGAALLRFAEQRVRPVAPELNWAAVAEVYRWLTTTIDPPPPAP